MTPKYEITRIAHPKFPWMHRIRALRNVREDVRAGDLGRPVIKLQTNTRYDI